MQVSISGPRRHTAVARATLALCALLGTTGVLAQNADGSDPNSPALSEVQVRETSGSSGYQGAQRNTAATRTELLDSGDIDCVLATFTITDARKKTYDFAKSLYVVAYQQNLHFKQFFKVLELLGDTWVQDCEHVNFGMVSMEEGTLSTRHGNVVYLEDVLDAAVEKTGKIIEEKSPDLPDKDEVAAAVGVGAVVWSMLYNSRIKDVTFSWKKVLNFDGETGPYAQYTHARCCSVLRKAGSYDVNAIDPSCFADDATAALAKAIAAFPAAVLAAAEKNEPYIVSRATMEVCTAFNKFYFCNQIITEDAGVSAARLALTDAARITIKKGLYLVGLQAPERM